MNKTEMNRAFPSLSRKIINSYSLHKLTSTASLSNTEFLEEKSIRFGDYCAFRADLIGVGFCSKVYKGLNQKTGQQVAIKVIELSKIKSPVQKRFLSNEISCLKKVKAAKHIIQIRQIIKTKTQVAIITELCKESLAVVMKRNSDVKTPLPRQLALKIFEQILIGYLGIRAVNYIHRDIKPANIFIGFDGMAKLGDLGFATADENLQEDRFINVGSPLYMAPQVLKGNHYSSKGDIWALGLVLLEMLIGDLPWANAKEEDLRQIIISTDFIRVLPNDLDSKWKAIVLKCLEIDPKKRGRALQIIKFFKPQFQQSMVEIKQSSRMKSVQKEMSLKQTIITAVTESQQMKIPNKHRYDLSIKQQKSITKNFSTTKGITVRRSVKILPLKSQLNIQQNPIMAKLRLGQSEQVKLIKKQQMASFHLGRLMFKVIQGLENGKDNIHCSCFSLSNEFQQKIAGYILHIFGQIKQLKSEFNSSISEFKRNKEYRNLLDIVEKYQKNYQEYFQLKLGHIFSETQQIEQIIKSLKQYIGAGHKHLLLISQELNRSGLNQITDSQICQFIELMNYLITLLHYVKLKKRNSILFVRINRIDQFIKEQHKNLSLREVQKILSKIMQ